MSSLRHGLALALAATLAVSAPGAAGAAPLDTEASSTGRVTVDAEVTGAIAAHGRTDFWVLLDAEADLSAAAGIADWGERGRYVHHALQTTAARSQSALLSKLTANGVAATGFWAANAVLVRLGDQAALDVVRNRPEVARITATGEVPLPDPAKAAGTTSTDVAWGVDRVGAPKVWSEYGVRGEGTVVGSIDSGAEYDHPAIAASYRGSRGDGTFDHNYNWFDPSYVCGDPSLEPCDNTGHGTHTVGTMVGDGGPGNHVGVAPGAKWISAKGCEARSCSYRALAAAMQWMLAPTDLSGQNPRPDLRPHVVNNSWGGPGGPPVLQQILSAWVAAGIMPVFSAGNDGPLCQTVGYPGALPDAYSVAAFDTDNRIADFSSRGYQDGKPDIAAPGVAVRSAVPGDGYEQWSGTSMAAPHVAGAVALLLSAAPLLVGRPAEIRALLDGVAVDAPAALDCGGVPGNDQTWGEGRLDVFPAVGRAPRDAIATVTGRVTDADGAPVAGATVQAAAGSVVRATTASADGSYRLVSAAGTVTIDIGGYGYRTHRRTVELPERSTTTIDVAIAQAPRRPVRGVAVREDGTPVAGLTATLVGTPLPPVTTGADGGFQFTDVPEGNHRLTLSGDRCLVETTTEITVEGDTAVRPKVSSRTDTGGYGYTCAEHRSGWVEADRVLVDRASGGGLHIELPVDLPFPFRLFGEFHERVTVWGDGRISLRSRASTELAPYLDQLFLDDHSSIRTAVVGQAPRRQFVIEWRDLTATDYDENQNEVGTYRVSFEALLGEDGTVTYQYRNLDPVNRGRWATVGIWGYAPPPGMYYSQAEPVLSDDVAIRFRPPASGVASGTVRDANDGRAVNGGTVSVWSGGQLRRRQQIRPDGRYFVEVPPGEHILEITSGHYAADRRTVRIEHDAQRVTADATLASGTVTADLSKLTVVGENLGRQRRTVRLTNSGDLPADYRVAEAHAPTAPGQYAQQAWRPRIAGTSTVLGIGLDPTTGNVWLGDGTAGSVHEFRPDGTPTGRVLGVTPAEETVLRLRDLTYDSRRGRMCGAQVYESILAEPQTWLRCWDATGALTLDVPGNNHPWQGAITLTYRPDDDTFYLAARDRAVRRLYHVSGESHARPGSVLDSCDLPDITASGLAWHAATKEIYVQQTEPRILRVDPDGCGVLGELTYPAAVGQPFGSIDLDRDGRIWGVASQEIGVVEPAIPSPVDQPWLTTSVTSGTLRPGQSAVVDVLVDTAGLAPGEARQAQLLVTSNTGYNHGVLQIPVTVGVPRYDIAVNVGGARVVGPDGTTWRADRPFTGSGDFGWDGRTTRAADAQVGDPVAADARVGTFGYEFHHLPDGVYEVALTFRDVAGPTGADRRFDVIAGGRTLLADYRPPADHSDVRRLRVEVTGGTLRLALVSRGQAPPLLNAVRVTERPDL
ncbi:subtilisin family serine protease [Micromonospora pisi]|uniref:Subtilisin family serine protease n=1 Tax=Micromonospora pisi TaxID=589240 RepID=A0A495JTZ0_9ACTN|nr:S8 family serine peptidase [Micromonospora pisi]RKR91792.1 subtilisin family serine protease [Micromonospora pisi]